MLKKLAALAVVAVLAAPAQAQDLDEVLNNYYEAIGGLDAWQSVQSMKMTGKMMMGGMGIEAPFTVMAKRPNMARIEFVFQGITGIQAYDGETAWQVMPFTGNKYFIPIRMEGVREVQGRTVEFETIVSDYKEVGGLMIAHSIEARPKGAPSGQAVTIDLVELNVEMADSLFVMPEKKEEGQQ
jgi:outer membrane lipoprotein-sorting protein